LGVTDPLCLSSWSPPFFSDYSFLVHHPVNRDDFSPNRFFKAVTYMCTYFRTFSHSHRSTGAINLLLLKMSTYVLTIKIMETAIKRTKKWKKNIFEKELSPALHEHDGDAVEGAEQKPEIAQVYCIGKGVFSRSDRLRVARHRVQIRSNPFCAMAVARHNATWKSLFV
jgi:hypothetical protein